MPITEVAQSVWGRGSILITLTALTATLALIIATSVGASRILFAKGRRAAAPAVFARLHPQFQVPWPALHFIFAAGIIGTFIAFACVGSYKAYALHSKPEKYRPHRTRPCRRVEGASEHCSW